MSQNPLFNRVSKRGVGEHGRSAEKKTAKRLNAQRTVGSGNTLGDKGDLKTEVALMELKTTTNNSFSVEYGWLHKITQEAIGRGKVPGLVVSFVTGSGSPKPGGAWLMVPLDYAKEKDLV